MTSSFIFLSFPERHCAEVAEQGIEQGKRMEALGLDGRRRRQHEEQEEEVWPIASSPWHTTRGMARRQLPQQTKDSCCQDGGGRCEPARRRTLIGQQHTGCWQLLIGRPHSGCRALIGRQYSRCRLLIGWQRTVFSLAFYLAAAIAWPLRIKSGGWRFLKELPGTTRRLSLSHCAPLIGRSFSVTYMRHSAVDIMHPERSLYYHSKWTMSRDFQPPIHVTNSGHLNLIIKRHKTSFLTWIIVCKSSITILMLTYSLPNTIP